MTPSTFITFDSAIAVIAWSLFATLLATALLTLFDLLTSGKLRQQVFTEGNRAAAIVYGAAFIGVCIVIASAMH